jgi:pimeloyl-ACP methyl ester carboxylesterase
MVAGTVNGPGERAHLVSRAVDLHTHILDVVNVLTYEDRHEVTLVGSSYAGMVITGVAEQVPERLSHLIYLNAFAPQDGQSLYDLVGPEIAACFDERARALGDGWRIPHTPPDADRRTDFLVNVSKQPLTVRNPEAARLMHTYVLHTAKPAGDLLGPIFAGIAERVRAEGWQYRELATGHWPLLHKPSEVAGLLLEVA